MNELGNLAPETILVAENLTRQFASLNVLSPISFDVMRGEFVAILGTSGCGKSTLLSILAGLTAPSSGTVRFYERDGQLDENGSRTSPPRSMMVFQRDGLLPWRTIGKNVALGLEYRRIPRPRIAAQVASSLHKVGLHGFSDYYPHQLSGGMRQRVAIARALVMEPRILLLDEPYGSLDAITRLKMQHDLLALRRETDKTVIMVTHDVDEALFLADRVIVLSPRPARILLDVPVDIDRPRERGGTGYNKLRHQLLHALGID